MNASYTAPVQLQDDTVAYRKISGIDNYNKTIKCTYFLVVLFIEGSGTHFIDDLQFPIAKNQLHFLFPGQHHQWVTGPETIAHKIVVGKKIFETFSSTDEFSFMRHNLNPVFKLSKPVFDRVNVEMESFQSDLTFLQENESWKKIVQLRMDILASMMRMQADTYLKNKLLPNVNAITKSYWDLIAQHYIEHKSMSWYADKLAVTPNYLNKLCKKQLNMTATDMIHYKVMQEAKRVLRFSDDSIKEITFNLGFESMAAFSAFFKKKSGFTPTEYRI